MYRVYDDRNDATLFESDEIFECTLYIEKYIGEDSEDYEHVWVEKVKVNECL